MIMIAGKGMVPVVVVAALPPLSDALGEDDDAVMTEERRKS